MEYAAIIFFVIFASSFPFVLADVWVPEDEFHGYFDPNGIYTVVGAVRNREDYSVLSQIEFVINEEGKTTVVTQQLPVIFPSTDIPFKLKFPKITNPNVVLEKPNVYFEKIDRTPSDIQIIYDKTLIKHKDGHLSGRIINQGNDTEYNVKVYATIHGKSNTFLDSGKNNEQIEKIEPGQIVEFSIYPDPSIASQINYYSCFAIGDPTVISLYAIRDGERFDFRYDSTAAFTVDRFDETGSTLYLDGINSFKVPTFVNFEFPQASTDEKFVVMVDGKKTDFIQSIDDEGNWHVAFNVDGASQNKIAISGFEKPKSSPLPTIEEIEMQKTTENFEYVIYLVVGLAISGGASAAVYRYRSKKAVKSN